MCSKLPSGMQADAESLPHPGTLILRCDVSAAMGTGHAMRCLALAQAWHDAGGQAVFVMAEGSHDIRDRLTAEGIEVAPIETNPGSSDDAMRLADWAQRYKANWLVVDGYQFDGAYQRDLKTTGFKMLFLDDHGHGSPYSADVVLNQNVAADAALYKSREPYTRLLLGPRYALLRRDFVARRGCCRDILPTAKKLLVTMGGSDPNNATLRVVQFLKRVQAASLQVVVVVGCANQHIESLKKAIAQHPHSIKLVQSVVNMARLMLWADLAVSGAGTTCWEMCFMGLPAALISLAPNQDPIAQSLAELGMAVYLGKSEDALGHEAVMRLESLIFSASARQKMSERGRDLIDGRGAARVVAFLRDTVKLRPAEHSDCSLLWQWGNDPLTRHASFSTEPISWDQHVRWFLSTLAEPDALLYVATNEQGIPLGQVRCQCSETRAVLSISLGAEFRGKGYGNRILTLVTEEVFQKSGVSAIDAYVKPDNAASIRLFKSAGFRRGVPEKVLGQLAEHFTLERGSLG